MRSNDRLRRIYRFDADIRELVTKVAGRVLAYLAIRDEIRRIYVLFRGLL